MSEYKDKLVMSCEITFIIYALSSILLFTDKSFPEDFIEVKSSPFVKRWQIVSRRFTTYFIWENSSGSLKTLAYRECPFKSHFMNSLFFKMYRKFDTNCEFHLESSIDTIFKEFVKFYELEADFSEVESEKTAGVMVLYYVYRNFFSDVSFKEFAESLRISKSLDHESFDLLEEMCITSLIVKSMENS